MRRACKAKAPWGFFAQSRRWYTQLRQGAWVANDARTLRSLPNRSSGRACFWASLSMIRTIRLSVGRRPARSPKMQGRSGSTRRCFVLNRGRWLTHGTRLWGGCCEHANAVAWADPTCGAGMRHSSCAHHRTVDGGVEEHAMTGPASPIRCRISGFLRPAGLGEEPTDRTDREEIEAMQCSGCSHIEQLPILRGPKALVGGVCHQDRIELHALCE